MASVKLITILLTLFVAIQIANSSTPTCCYKQAFTSDSQGRPTVICVLPMPCKQTQTIFDDENDSKLDVDGALNRGARKTIWASMNCPEGYYGDGNRCREIF